MKTNRKNIPISIPIFDLTMKGLLTILIFLLCCQASGHSQIPIRYINQDHLAKTWDEAIPLGNGRLGTLIWNKADKIRFALDNSQLWDERPMKGLHGPHFSYKWVEEKWKADQYDSVQRALDYPYDHEPAPTKIPGAAIELPISLLGTKQTISLDLYTASATIIGDNGTSIQSFVDAKQTKGWIRIKNIQQDLDPSLLMPPYQNNINTVGDVVGGDDLGRLGYPRAQQDSGIDHKTFLQKGWGNFSYRSTIVWKRKANDLELVWTIETSKNKNGPALNIIQLRQSLEQGYDLAFKKHQDWWAMHWEKSSIDIPDSTLMRQWYLTRYFMGSASRKGGSPISLQAIWTADNGKIAPWKGDYHHDLNTELSYWPFYTANDLEGASVFIDHLEKNKLTYEKYTRDYFNATGINVPGVTTLKGKEMGGWIQYALSPTTSSWLAFHYDQQWKYSGDRTFLQNKAYPWFKSVAEFLEKITYTDSNGIRQLPISSSPEFYDNDARAWFQQTTNFDLALMRYVFVRAADMAMILGKTTEAKHWESILTPFPSLALSKSGGLALAPKQDYAFSHRHFSHLMAIYPLGLLNKDHDRFIIERSMRELDSIGSKGWVGYSFAWQGNLYARLGEGDKAAKALRIFSEAFCLPYNGFHVNGDQSGKGYASATYRPFTLEGNFAFASGLQEMLIQSFTGYIEIMPAIPSDWRDLQFKNFRTEGGFLIDAIRKQGKMIQVKIKASDKAALRIKLEGKWKWRINGEVLSPMHNNGFFTAKFKKGSAILLTRE